MSAASAKLLVAVFDHVVCIKINGRADFNSSLDLKKLINELWERGYQRFVLELCECMMMDSTFLGMISGIALKLRDPNNPQSSPLELFNPSPRISEVLENLGVEHLFKINRGADPLAVHYEAITPSAQPDKAEVTRNCLEAHKTLMDLQPANVQKFKDVAQFLAEDLKRLESLAKK